MKNTRALVMLAVSLLAALGAVTLAARWLSQQAAAAATPVVVAARDIDLGTPLAPDMLRVIDWPASSALKDPVADPKLLEGRVVMVNVAKGEPVLAAKLAPVGAKGGLSAVIAEGKRAITVKVNEVVGVAGFALPGNYVDIVVNSHDEQDKPVSRIVLQKILVLAIAQEAARDETKPKVVNAVTLEVSPAEAEKVDLARSVGSLSLVLRNQVDQQPAVTAGVRKEDLLALAPPRVQPAAAVPAARPVVHKASAHAMPAPTRNKVEIIKGVQRSDVDF